MIESIQEKVSRANAIAEEKCQGDPLRLLSLGLDLVDVDLSETNVLQVAKGIADTEGFLQKARFRLVPGRIKEEMFWSIVFSLISEEEKIIEHVWTDVLAVRVCYLYIVPRQGLASSGHYASTWGLVDPLYTGKLLLQVNELDELLISVLDQCSGHLYASSAKIHLNDIASGTVSIGAYCEPVLDSSRYFVVRIEDPGSGKKGIIGLGFHTRGDSFDFNATVQDCIRRVKRQLGLLTQHVDEEKDDLKLPQVVRESTNFSSMEPIRLKPLALRKKKKKKVRKPRIPSVVKEEEWGDFEGAVI